MICVDASLIAKLFLQEADSSAAASLFSTWSAQSEQLVAPSILSYEMSNIFWRQCFTKNLNHRIAQRLLSDFLRLDIEFFRDAELHERAIAITSLNFLPATYDAHYIALAERLSCEFWTADKRLVNALRGRLPFVRDLATYSDDSIQSAT